MEGQRHVFRGECGLVTGKRNSRKQDTAPELGIIVGSAMRLYTFYSRVVEGFIYQVKM
jgi:hypothetical protein